MNLSIGNRIALGFAVALLALLVIGTVSYRNLIELNGDSRLVAHTLEVLQKSDALLADLMQAENSARGYELTGDSAFRGVFNARVDDLARDLAGVRALTTDNQAQQARLTQLEQLMSRRLDISRQLMRQRELQGVQNDPRYSAMVREGREQTQEARRLIGELEQEERSLLAERQAQAQRTAELTKGTIAFGTLIALALVTLISLLVTRSITVPLDVLRDAAERIGAGDYEQRARVDKRDEIGHLAEVFNRMAAEIQQRQRSLAEQDWLKTSVARFSRLLEGQRDLGVVCRALLNELAALLSVRHAVLYVPDPSSPQSHLLLTASYACEHPPARIEAGDGLIGQCFLERRLLVLDDIPADYIKITSALGAAGPTAVLVLPALFEGHVTAVIELAAFRRFTDIELAFLAQLAESLGVVLTAIQASTRTEELLAQATTLSESLRAQQAELNRKNRELEVQAAQLGASETILSEQQEELRQANEELEQANEELQQANEEMEEKANLLAAQKSEVERINREIDQARADLEQQAAQLALTSRYKSEFLANMSHELRTPLNSLLILSQMLADNSGGNLTPKQVQFAQTIQSSGNDLLELINDVLDLSKIESGTVELEVDDAQFGELAQVVEGTFRQLADNKRLDFRVELEPGLPKVVTTDVRRLHQILKNLLSNAFKFTDQGSVTLRVRRVTDGWDARSRSLDEADAVVAFAVTDTGIGIPEDKQQVIFEAFQQAETGIARKYGGTGLGLSISRELTRLLGGALKVSSVPGHGSTFTLYLPATLRAGQAYLPHSAKTEGVFRPDTQPPVTRSSMRGESVDGDAAGVADDRAQIQPGDLVLLIIEDDRNFARILVDFARERRFKAVVAHTAAAGTSLARELVPAAITLDVRLPDNDGWVVLDTLKHDARTRHIPVHLVTVEEQRERALRLGAVSYLQKPVSKAALDGALSQTVEFLNRPIKNLLLIEDDPTQRQSIVELIGNTDVHTSTAGSAAEALANLERERFDCVVLDLGLPDMNGTALIKQMHKAFGPRTPPIIVYTARELTRSEETELRMIAESIIVKGVRSPERLLDETALFLHRVQSKLPESKRRMIEQVHKADSILSGRKVLVVDDDVRNIFAVTSALESYRMQVLYAESGEAGIHLLRETPDVDVVLMDVMMPEMDGFEAIRRIRQMDRFARLPIISVTAKAMKGDREMCLEAGASDYITKPLDMDQLRSLLRVWLYR
jgi:signal transduction histidine kinase/DNA-binding response OmpR family regulator/CHASE3 domain sensor protein